MSFTNAYIKQNDFDMKMKIKNTTYLEIYLRSQVLNWKQENPGTKSAGIQNLQIDFSYPKFVCTTVKMS